MYVRTIRHQGFDLLLEHGSLCCHCVQITSLAPHVSSSTHNVSVFVIVIRPKYKVVLWNQSGPQVKNLWNRKPAPFLCHFYAPPKVHYRVYKSQPSDPPEGGAGLVPKRGCLLTLAYYLYRLTIHWARWPGCVKEIVHIHGLMWSANMVCKDTINNQFSGGDTSYDKQFKKFLSVKESESPLCVTTN
jgi:hypothetical protein